MTLLLHAQSVQFKVQVMAGHYYFFNRTYNDMIKMLGACDGNAHAAAILYAKSFPRLCHSHDRIIRKLPFEREA
jgi:hypothetical protein